MKNNRYVAFNAADYEFAEFKTLEDAEKWLKQDDEDGISQEACDGRNWIAEIKYRSKVTEIDNKSNYHVHTDECPDDCDEEEWSHDDFDWIGKHEYELIKWNN